VDEGKKGRAPPEPHPPIRIGNPSRRAVRPTNMNPRDFEKAAPYLGALLLAAVAFTVVDRGSLSLLVGLRSDPMDLVPGVKHRILGEVFRVRNGNGHARIINLQQCPQAVYRISPA
jgi:hypothetical protein